MKIMLAPTYEIANEFAQTHEVAATVEAEYGGKVVRGQEETLAHHAIPGDPPCLRDNSSISGDLILVSHLDLDTIGGVLSLMGTKPEVAPHFWEYAGYVDVQGPHKLKDIYNNDETSDEEKHAIECIMAFWAWHESSPLHSRFSALTDVSNLVLDAWNFLSSLGTEDIEKGLEWDRQKTEEVESKLVTEDPSMRVFISDGVFCNGSYYSPTLQMVVPSILTLNTKFGTITLSFAEGGNAKEVMQDFFGPLAGGHAGIAGTPRNERYDETDLMDFIQYLNGDVSRREQQRERHPAVFPQSDEG